MRIILLFIIFLYVPKIQGQDKSIFMTKIIDSSNKKTLLKIDSIIFIHKQTNEKYVYRNLIVNNDFKFKIGQLKEGNYEISIYNFGYTKFVNNYKISNIPALNLCITLNKNPFIYNRLGIIQKIYEQPKIRQKQITIEYPICPLKDNSDSLLFFVNRNIDNKLLKSCHFDEFEVFFTVDSLGIAKLKDVKNNNISLNTTIQDVFKKAINSFPKWIVRTGLNMKEANYSFIYAIK